MRILVVGATGALGRPVVRLLRAQGVAVRALNRHPTRAADLAALGAEVMAGDLAEPASLERACAGVDRVLASAHGMLGRGRHRSENVDDAGHRALIAAAAGAGVRRFVYTSAYGARADHPSTSSAPSTRSKSAGGQRTRCGRAAAHGLHGASRPSVHRQERAREGQGAAHRPGHQAAQLRLRCRRRPVRAARPARRPAAVSQPRHRRAGHYSNADVAALYARTAGIAPRTSHLPSGVAAALAALAGPLHPGVARVLRLASLPDDAFSERFEAGVDFERDLGVRMTSLEEFVGNEVQRAGVKRNPA
jgi:uncharacterized protein YbjT (DUF2867 family)